MRDMMHNAVGAARTLMKAALICCQHFRTVCFAGGAVRLITSLLNRRQQAPTAVRAESPRLQAACAKSRAVRTPHLHISRTFSPTAAQPSDA